MHRLSQLLSPHAERQSLALKSLSGLQLTYSALQQEVNEQAQQLTALGVQAQDRVGLLLPKSTTSVVAILAILEIDAVYVPVDVHGPLSRAAYIFNDCQVKVILVDKAHTTNLQAAISSKLIPTAASFDILLIQEADPSSKQSAASPENLAFILYTSGSTGKPKGVKITHQNALAFVNWARQEFKIGPQDILSSIAPFHFDLSVFDLFVSLSSGACLVILDDAASKNPLLMAEVLAREKVSVLYATPTLLQLLLNYGKLANYDFQKLRLLLYAGEVFPPLALHNLRQVWTEAQVYNLYGPTETNVVTFHHVGAAEEAGPIPIGRSCPYADCRLWQDGFLPQQAGQQGEIWVSGQSVAQGYVGPDHRPAFTEIEGVRWYKTGDLARIDAQGNFVFVGRIDRMIKRRGYRIELAEIENALLAHPLIAEVAVVPHHNKKQQLKLVAFYTQADPQVKPPGFLELKQFCKTNLPAYMEPDSFRVLAEIPKTSTQKLNFQALQSLLS